MHRCHYTPAGLPGVHLIDLRSDRRFPRHAHDQYGIGVMLDGGHRSWSGRGLVEAGPNDVITVSPNELHDGIPLRDAPRHWCMMFVEPSVVARLAGADMAAREFHHPALADPLLARRLTTALRDLPQAGADEGAEIVTDLFAALLDDAHEAPATVAPSPGVHRMLERIHDDPVSAPSLAALAGIAGLTPYTALRRFRREVGTPPHAYLKQYRVRLACQAIAAGHPLAEAALRAGFADQSHMTRAFVRQLGVTPGQWRP
ncbi:MULTISPECIES: AraC family transcriptional regulator [unclassified Modicisalibacter]|uniref:AraC family transcriptional regulator n=1 Tax=unclassified Modicisalibacter TaxID=2679913 RepID=UPI001CCB5AA0|nr:MULTISPECIES: AraC family transcriptional regulator [unclassified Modicisalibacter]MBZ9557820.1 AraC family transcriptional regulator [Modicisalibacter sp. R2A 31.J]MBZ9573514.1 AraC family transcriptional regulator [Modicisalibacter sp. MOD 31.J]